MVFLSVINKFVYLKKLRYFEFKFYSAYCSPPLYSPERPSVLNVTSIISPYNIVSDVKLQNFFQK